MEELKYQYWLLRNEDINYSKKAKLIEYFYDSFNLYNSTKSDLLNSNILDEKTVDIFIENRKKFNFDKEYENFLRTPFSFITMEDDKYPKKLMDIYDKPYGLFYLGDLPEFGQSVSIVGARRCSAYGKRLALDIGQKLGESGFKVISGMARGIDSYGHRGCIDGGGVTVAVLGCGCDVVYPRENRQLYEEIVNKNGAIISEYQMGTSPLPMNFPRRNRIVSALADIVVVIEARDKSGSLITADFALEQGKDIYVTPGRIGDSLSLGVNKLIAQGAGVIYDTSQFVKDLQELHGLQAKPPAKKTKSDTIPKLSERQKKIYALFDEYPTSLASIVENSSMDYLEILSIILSLERIGLLTEVYKNNYVKMT